MKNDLQKPYIGLKGQSLEIMEVKNNIESISFSSFDEQKAIRTFDLKQELKVNLLAGWESKATETPLTEIEEKHLEQLQ